MRTKNSQLGALHEGERGRGGEGERGKGEKGRGGTASSRLGLICRLEGGRIQDKQKRS